MTITLEIPREYLIKRKLDKSHHIKLHEDYTFIYAYIFIGSYVKTENDTYKIRVKNLFFKQFRDPNKGTCSVYINKGLSATENVLVFPVGPEFEPIIELNIDNKLLYPCKVVARGKGGGKINLPVDYLDNGKVQVLFFSKNSNNVEEILEVGVEAQNDRHSQVRLHRSYVGRECFVLRDNI